MPALRWANDYRRGLRSRLQAPIRSAGYGASLDRHVMTPFLLFPNRNTGRDHCWTWPGYADACHRRPCRSSETPKKASLHPGGRRSCCCPWLWRLQKALNYPLAQAIWAFVSAGPLTQSHSLPIGCRRRRALRPAISCLGAFRTPAGARGWPSHGSHPENLHDSRPSDLKNFIRSACPLSDPFAGYHGLNFRR